MRVYVSVWCNFVRKRLTGGDSEHDKKGPGEAAKVVGRRVLEEGDLETKGTGSTGEKHGKKFVSWTNKRNFGGFLKNPRSLAQIKNPQSLASI